MTNKQFLRHAMRFGLFGGIFGSVGVAVGLWLAHKVTTPGSTSEELVMLFGMVLFQLLGYDVQKRVFPNDRRNNSGMTPPLNAEFVFYLFMSRLNADAIVGDLEEGYKALLKKFGRRRARFWYWTQVVVSVGPIVLVWVKRVVRKPVMALVGWAVGKGIVGHDGWLAALVELWKKVRS